MPPGHEGRDQEFPQHAGRSIKKYFRELNELVPQLPYGAITSIAAAFLDAFAEQRTVYVFGKGGGGLGAGQRPRVMALTDNVSLISAWANDFGYERIFSEQLKTFLKPRDVAFAISTSGDSPNVLLAL